MTNEIQNTVSPQPIQDWENREVHGEGMACKTVHDDHVSKVAELRQRQEAYEASLPKDQAKALTEINKVLCDSGDLDSPEYAARAALTIINELAAKGGMDDSPQMNNAVYWLSEKGLDGLQLIETGVKRSKDIAHQFHPAHDKYRA